MNFKGTLEYVDIEGGYFQFHTETETYRLDFEEEPDSVRINNLLDTQEIVELQADTVGRGFSLTMTPEPVLKVKKIL